MTGTLVGGSFPAENSAVAQPGLISINEQRLAILQPARGFETHRVELPPKWTANLDDTFAILQLDTETWRPSNWIPDATDIRDLGVRIDWIEVR